MLICVALTQAKILYLPYCTVLKSDHLPCNVLFTNKLHQGLAKYFLCKI